MLRFLTRLLLTFSSTAWMLVVYACKSEYTLGNLHIVLSSAVYISCIILLSHWVLKLTKKPDPEKINEIKTQSLADNEFIPVYLGYFFAALSVNSDSTMIVVYFLVFIMIYMMSYYFNPAFLLFGYHCYHITNENGTEMFLISKLTERNPESIKNLEVRRIDDMSFISH